MTIELVPLCTVEVTLRDPISIGEGPSGNRMIFEVTEGTIEGDRFAGRMFGHASADWVTLTGTLATLDVRATVETSDGALVLAQYRGRTDLTTGTLYVAPLFETGDPRYSWLNAIQAVGKGSLEGSHLRYEWCEAR